MDTVMLEINWQNICLVSVNELISYSSITTINNLNSYEIDCNLKNRVCKRFIISDLIHKLCESLNDIKTTNKVVFYYNKEDKNFNWYNEYFNGQDIGGFFEKTLDTISKNMPIRIFTGKVSLSYIKHEIQHNNQDVILFVNEIGVYTSKCTSKPATFTKAKKFLEKYELKFLANKYFTTVKSKQLLYK